MLKKFTPDLVELGLSEKEALVYLSLLGLGSSTAEKIATDTKLNRSTTYVQIKSLMKKGFVSTYKVGKKTMFASESPTHLERLLAKRQRELEEQHERITSVIPQLAELFSENRDRPAIRLFEGKEGLVSMRNEILHMKGEEFYAATSLDAMLKIFTMQELDAYSAERARRGLSSVTLYNSARDDEEPVGNQRIKRLSEKDFPFSADVYIYDNNVSFAATSGNIVGVIIESESIAKTMRTLFESAWQAHE